MTRLLLAYDGSDPAIRAIETAATLFPGAEAVIGTVMPPELTLESASMARVALPNSIIRTGVANAHAEHEREAAERVARGDAIAAAVGLRVTHAIVEGVTPWRALRTLADELEVDVIVCGSRGETTINRAVFGSTANGLLHHADRPLLVVPPALKETEAELAG